MAEVCSILIIDDNIDDREVYRRILGRVSSTAYRVVEAETGEEGLALNHRKRPNCILLDYSLPGRDGLGVLADILEADPAANVIMISIFLVTRMPGAYQKSITGDSRRTTY